MVTIVVSLDKGQRKSPRYMRAHYLSPSAPGGARSDVEDSVGLSGFQQQRVLTIGADGCVFVCCL